MFFLGPFCFSMRWMFSCTRCTADVPLKDFSPTPDMESELDATFYHSIFSWCHLTFFHVDLLSSMDPIISSHATLFPSSHCILHLHRTSHFAFVFSPLFRTVHKIKKTLYFFMYPPSRISSFFPVFILSDAPRFFLHPSVTNTITITITIYEPTPYHLPTYLLYRYSLTDTRSEQNEA
jgi:hypothetical protein